jgi:hypothetical protein
MAHITGLDFEAYLKDAAKKATIELREAVIKANKNDPENENIYPYEATVTALVFHHLLNRGLSIENMSVEASYDDGKRRMDLSYFDTEKQEKYSVEVKTVLQISKKGLLYKRRDGLVGIEEDIGKLMSLKGKQKRIIIVAYFGVDNVDNKTFKEWENQIGEHKGVTIMFS